jgi:hypothetical protein
MKKHLLLLLLTSLYCIVEVQSQNTLSYGVRAGVNLSAFRADNKRSDQQFILGYHAGVNVEIPLIDQLFLQPNLLLSTKGVKYPAAFESGYGDPIAETIHCLEIQLPFLYKYSLGPGNLLLGAGPFISQVLQGTLKSGNEKHIIKFSKSSSWERRTDVGLNLSAGYELNKKITAQIMYNPGLVSIKRPENNNSKRYNNGYSLSIGYRL